MKDTHYYVLYLPKVGADPLKEFKQSNPEYHNPLNLLTVRIPLCATQVGIQKILNPAEEVTCEECNQRLIKHLGEEL